MFVRIFFLLAAGAMYLGRLDTHFLAKDIRRAGPYINFDEYSSFHLKDILSHEVSHLALNSIKQFSRVFLLFTQNTVLNEWLTYIRRIDIHISNSLACYI